MKNEVKEKLYNTYKVEIETYFITKFIEDNKGVVKRTISDCLEVVFDRLLGSQAKPSGLIVHSQNFGQGKTLFFEVSRHMSQRVLRKTPYKITTAKDLCKIYATGGQEALDEVIKTKNLFIDDLGAEKSNRKFYGDEMNVLLEVITKRYEIWIEYDGITHFTTNLNLDELAAMYDRRTADRLAEMTQWYEFDFLEEGQSFRQTSASRRLSENEKPKPGIEAEPVKPTDNDFYRYLNTCADEYRLNGATAEQPINFFVMYGFFEKKGYQVPAATPADIHEANNIRPKNSGRGNTNKVGHLLQSYQLNHDEAVLAVRAKNFFINLAANNHVFSEADTVRQM